MDELNKTDLTTGNPGKLLECCTICPHKCGANRKQSIAGFCKAGHIPVVSCVMSHHGEEPPISGTRGSGTIFFSHCNMRCDYCQNYQISQEYMGSLYTAGELASSMLKLHEAGAHNINLVSPSIWIPQIIQALSAAKQSGLNIPIVYNTGGYDDPDIIKMLDGIIDIYMPDIRYSSNTMAEKYSHIKNYVEYSRASVREMYRQAGILKLDKKGIAKKGMIIRLLVMPGDIAGINETLDFLKNELSPDIHLSIMAQYHPEYKACTIPVISRRISEEEYSKVTDYAEELGFYNGWTQEYSSLSEKEDLFIPDFKNKKVFKYYEDENKKD
jgi:putative pyruvate formate lyase activating enzyme